MSSTRRQAVLGRLFEFYHSTYHGFWNIEDILQTLDMKINALDESLENLRDREIQIPIQQTLKAFHTGIFRNLMISHFNTFLLCPLSVANALRQVI